MYKRPIYKTLLKRLREPRRFIQVLTGPRQVGKTVLARQVTEALNIPSHYASADEPTLRDRTWLEQQWDLARLQIHPQRGPKEALLVLDEVQKVTDWSEVVKRLWDEDSASRRPLKVVLLGSAPLLIQKGLTESLAGRFEVIAATHWSYGEMREAFGWELEQYIFYGGYPGSAELVSDENRWRRYIIDSLIETTISRDILLLTRVDKPALLRRLFQLACDYSGQVVSYQKMLGQLQDAGNTTTLAHYLDLLAGAGMIAGLPKYSGGRTRQRGSSPKLQVMNNALMTAPSAMTFNQARKDRDYWGRLVESALGAYLVNGTRGTSIEVFYWRERSREVDFVLRSGQSIVALEVKSGRAKESLAGMEALSKEFRLKRKLLVGGGGIPLEDFLLKPVEHWLT
ncbi:MAG: ATP-binding protein [Deltaproteobacteria bacterium]|nr:ATP-binding protein [Deltaproteobacteria bacterium]